MDSLSIKPEGKRVVERSKNLEALINRKFFNSKLKKIVTYTAGVLVAFSLTNPMFMITPKYPQIKALPRISEVMADEESLDIEELLNAKVSPSYSEETYEAGNLHTSELLNKPVDEKMDISIQIGNSLYVVSYNGEGELKEMDFAPFVKDYRTMVPVRFIVEGLGANIGWNDEEKKVSVNYDDKEINFYIGNKSYTITSNGTTETKQLDVAPEIVNGRTVIPLRAVAETMGLKLDWNPDILMVVIEKTDKTNLNLYSDYDNDGIPLWKEMVFKSDPHKEYSLSNLIPDGEIVSWAETQEVDIKHYESKNGLGVVANAYLDLNPYKESNFGLEISDKELLEYALEHGITTVNRGSLSHIVDIYKNH